MSDTSSGNQPSSSPPVPASRRRLAPAHDGIHLTPRQQQVLADLLAAKAPKQIAHAAGLSIHTVREYIQALYKKFGVNGRDELMALCLRDDRTDEPET